MQVLIELRLEANIPKDGYIRISQSRISCLPRCGDEVEAYL